MQTRDRAHLHRLVDGLPDAALPAAEQYFETLHGGDDPIVTGWADAPDDNEPVTAEQAADIDEAEADLAAGRIRSHEEVRRRLLGTP